ncbi:unnamed protein product [Thelazia callipaeda]|uniref:Reverse transcriptase domain-containing protein n=1 Tax=Thelazia callipaeda TaxID=103827 RepID=A0A0N5D200_THECL|nr:unnamed protein product [Thelazia callipaeda]
MDRQLSAQYKVTKGGVPTNQGMHITNHLLFVDDLKIFATGKDIMKSMAKSVEKFLDVAGLEVNSAKSATNTEVYTDKDRLIAVDTEKKREYDLLANKLGAELECRTKIISYVITWNGLVTNFRKRCAKEISVFDHVENILLIVLKEMLESISFDQHCGFA